MNASDVWWDLLICSLESQYDLSQLTPYLHSVSYAYLVLLGTPTALVAAPYAGAAIYAEAAVHDRYAVGVIEVMYGIDCTLLTAVACTAYGYGGAGLEQVKVPVVLRHKVIRTKP